MSSYNKKLRRSCAFNVMQNTPLAIDVRTENYKSCWLKKITPSWKHHHKQVAMNP